MVNMQAYAARAIQLARRKLKRKATETELQILYSIVNTIYDFSPDTEVEFAAFLMVRRFNMCGMKPYDPTVIEEAA